MKPLPIGLIAAFALGGLALGLLVQAMLLQSNRPLIITPWLALVFLLLAIWLGAVGVGIRRLKRKERTWVTPVLAGRTALLARAVVPVATFFATLLLGIALVSFGRSQSPLLMSVGWSATVGAVGAFGAATVAFLVERWAIDTGDDSSTGGSKGSKSRPTPPAGH